MDLNEKGIFLTNEDVASHFKKAKENVLKSYPGWKTGFPVEGTGVQILKVTGGCLCKKKLKHEC